jgi:hypothetical protein
LQFNNDEEYVPKKNNTRKQIINENSLKMEIEEPTTDDTIQNGYSSEEEPEVYIANFGHHKKKKPRLG